MIPNAKTICILLAVLNPGFQLHATQTLVSIVLLELAQDQIIELF
jgi:hypothetical protein